MQGEGDSMQKPNLIWYLVIKGLLGEALSSEGSISADRNLIYRQLEGTEGKEYSIRFPACTGPVSKHIFLRTYDGFEVLQYLSLLLIKVIYCILATLGFQTIQVFPAAMKYHFHRLKKKPNYFECFD